MNAVKRKRISKALELINIVKSQVESIMLEEQIAFDNTPENLQDSEKGDKMQSCISQLEDAVDYLESTIEALEEAVI